MSRSYTAFGDSQPLNDGRREASYTEMAPSDHFHQPLITRHRYRSQQEEKFRELKILHYKPCSPAEKVEEILSKVRDGACRGSTGPVTLPMTTTQGWRSGPNQILQENNRKYDDERNSPEFYERLGGNEGYVPKTQPKRLNGTNTSGPNAKVPEPNPKRNAAVLHSGEIAGRKKTPEKIDSKEASRRYGKLPSWSGEEEEYEGTITSEQAMAKYGGALV